MTELKTGLDTSGGQAVEATVCGRKFVSNGYDPIQVYDGVRAATYNAGLAPPAQVVVTSPDAGSVIAGTYICTVVYLDTTVGEIPRASSVAPLTTVVAPGSKKFTVAIVASADARVTHVALLITGTNGTVLGEAKRVANTTANTYVDASDIAIAETISPEYLLQPNTAGIATDLNGAWDLRENDVPPTGLVIGGHDGRMVVGKPVPYRTGAVSTTNGSPTVTGTGTNFLSAPLTGLGPQDNWRLKLDGVAAAHTVSSVGDVTSITLATNFVGAYVLAQYALYSLENSCFWISKKRMPESFQTESRIPVFSGDDTFEGFASHPQGILVYGRSSMELVSFNDDPLDVTQRRHIPIPGRRGTVNHHTIQGFEGKYYALDEMGVHVWAGGGMPQNVSEAMRDDIADIDWSRKAKFHATIDAATKTYRCFVCRTGESEPRTVLVYEIGTGIWRRYASDAAITCAFTGRDSEGRQRTYYGTKATSSHVFVADVGTTDGGKAGTTLIGTVTGTPTQTSVQVSEGGLYIGGQACTGLYLYSADLDESVEISSNTATTFTLAGTGFSAAPAVGSLVHIGRIKAYFKTRVYAPSHANQKIRVLGFILRFRPLSSQRYAYVTAYEGLSETPISDWPESVSGNGYTVTVGNAEVKVDLTDPTGVVRIPIGDWQHSICFKVEIRDADAQASILDVQVEFAGEREGTQ